MFYFSKFLWTLIHMHRLNKVRRWSMKRKYLGGRRGVNLYFFPLYQLAHLVMGIFLLQTLFYRTRPVFWVQFSADVSQERNLERETVLFSFFFYCLYLFLIPLTREKIRYRIITISSSSFPRRKGGKDRNKASLNHSAILNMFFWMSGECKKQAKLFLTGSQNQTWAEGSLQDFCAS